MSETPPGPDPGDAPGSPTPDSGKPRSWSTFGGLALAGLGLAIIAVLGGAALLGLLGSTMTSAPSARPSSSAASTPAGFPVTPRPPGATGSALPRPTATPPPAAPLSAEAAGALSGFFELVGDERLAYRELWAGQILTPGQLVSFKGEFRVAGPDYAGALTTAAGQSELAYVRGVLYARLNGGAWSRRTIDEPFVRRVPLLGLTGRADLAYLGPITIQGRRLHRFVSSAAYRAPLEAMLNLRTLFFTPLAITLTVDLAEKGTPAYASVVVEAERIRAGAAWTFSAVGEKLAIEPPQIGA